MAYILTRKYPSGATRYTAIIRIRKGKCIVHREAKTFEHRSAALAWAKHREVALEDPDTRAHVLHSETTLAELIRWYIDSFETVSQWQRSKQTHLEFLERHTIGRRDVLSLTVTTLIDHVRTRRADGAGPATVANDLTWIGVVLRAARNIKQLPIKPEIALEARNACRTLRLIGKARRRDRRPTPDEMMRLDAFFASRDQRSEIPMRDIVGFAIHSARRQAEICRLEWSDNDPGLRTGLVRDAKHPTEKHGNHRRFKYTPEAWEIVQRQPRTSKYIFPYDAKSIGAAFTRACQLLGIPDLHFHDLRHEATSRLFEKGYQIHEVAHFTLHESWSELKRYANLKPENIPDLDAARSNSLVATQPSHAVDRSARRDPRRSRARAISVRQVGKRGKAAASPVLGGEPPRS
jgi:integrase